MKIAILAPSDKTFIKEFLPNASEDILPLGYTGAPFIGTLIKEFLAQGNKVEAITTSEAVNEDYTIKVFSEGNFSWTVVPYRPNSIRNNGKKIGRILDAFAFEQKQMVKVLKQIKPDFVHAHWSYEFAGAAIKSNFPYLVTVHDNPFVILKYFKNFYRFIRLLMAEKNLKKVDYATTVSPYMLDYVNKRCNNVEVVPNPVQIIYQKNEVINLINKKVETINAPRIFMINNGWDERKNGKKALMAFQLLLKSIPNASLHLYGTDSEKGGMAYNDAQNIGIHNVSFNGKVTRKELMNDLEKAHLFLHPALEESFGVVLIESMSMGIPTIGGNSSGAVPWVINEPELLVDVNDIKQIVERILELLTKKEIYKKLALRGYLNVVDRFSSSSVAKAYLNNYDVVLKNKKNEHSI